MRKLILLITLIGSILCQVAYADTNNYIKNCGISVTYENVDSLSSTLIKNNIRTKFFEEPFVELIISLDDEKINFKVYSMTKVGNTHYIFGNGSYNIHVICVEGDKVSFPIAKNRTMTLTDAQFAKSIINNFDSIPSYNGEFKEI